MSTASLLKLSPAMLDALRAIDKGRARAIAAPTLDAIEHRGLVESIGSRRAPRSRRTYQLTALGRKALEANSWQQAELL